jgi:hypothetical protein
VTWRSRLLTAVTGRRRSSTVVTERLGVVDGGDVAVDGDGEDAYAS